MSGGQIKISELNPIDQSELDETAQVPVVQGGATWRTNLIEKINSVSILQAEAIANAKDEAIESSNEYTDDQDVIQLQAAKDYADGKDAIVLTSANAYTDAKLEGLQYKSPVDAATTGNITLSGIQTIDGVTTPASVLVKSQTAATENGIYVPAAGAWVRRSDMNSALEFPSAYVEVKAGTVNADTQWKCTNDIVVVGTTNISFAPVTVIGVEFQANKDTDPTFTANSDVKYPSQKAVKTAVDLKLSISAAAAYILATVLTGFSASPASAVVAADSILAAFGKLQAQINANVATLATKATINGDAPAGTYRLGTTNSQSFALRTNGTDRLTVDAGGNIVQAGTTTNFDIVVFRIRNLAGSFWRVFTNTITGRLDFGGDFTEINFTKPITNWKGTDSRVVESDSAGNTSAIEKIVSLKIFNATVQGLLSDATNWHKVTGVYTGASLTSYALEQGMYYEDSDYFYFMNTSTVPMRIAKSNIINKTKAAFVTATASVTSYTERFFFVNGSFNFALPDPALYEFVELTFKNISASDTCTLTGYNVDTTTNYAIAPLGFVKIKSSGAGWYKID
jgi:hypothetical protein